MAIIIAFEKPDRKDYHNLPDCPPRKRGDGCYGDCGDCYARERDLYNRRKKKMDNRKGAKRRWKERMEILLKKG